jgi:ribosomal protein S18 acetylase RimI-like enzyme
VQGWVQVAYDMDILIVLYNITRINYKTFCFRVQIRVVLFDWPLFSKVRRCRLSPLSAPSSVPSRRYCWLCVSPSYRLNMGVLRCVWVAAVVVFTSPLAEAFACCASTSHRFFASFADGYFNRRSRTSASLSAVQNTQLFESLQSPWNKNEANNNPPLPIPSSDNRVPFIIERIGRGTESELKEISRLCIDVFFNKQENVEGLATNKQVAPWKSVQLAYLRTYQYGDLMARNAFKQNEQVDLIVARRVYPIKQQTDNMKMVDSSQIYNLGQTSAKRNAQQFAAGEIIGYAEVSEKIFGLGGKFDTRSSEEKLRPYLSNLSVVEYARQSGVGSKLLDACEKAVLNWNATYSEIVLQVEEDNTSAIKFYKRRGWEFVFADPTCRRYDTSGLFLKETRITKYAMLKRLDLGGEDNGSKRKEDASDFGSSLIKKLRGSWFVSR